MSNPTINNSSGVTPLNDDYSLEDVDRYIEEVKYKQTEFTTNSSRAIAEVTNNACNDLQAANAMKRQKLNEEIGPPAWFVSFEGRFNESMAGLKRELNEVKKDVGELKKDVGELKKDVGELKKDVGELKADYKALDARMTYLDAKHFNELKRNRGDPINPIMFLDGSMPGSNLRGVKYIEDIDKISKRDMLEYLRGYRVDFDPNELTVSLRSKLRDALGLSSAYDLGFEFHDARRE